VSAGSPASLSAAQRRGAQTFAQIVQTVVTNAYNSPAWVQDFIAPDLGVIGEEGEIVGGAPGPSSGSILCGLDFVDARQPWIAVFTTADTQFDGSSNAPDAQPTSGPPQVPHANVSIGANGVLTPLTGGSAVTSSTAAAPPAASSTGGGASSTSSAGSTARAPAPTPTLSSPPANGITSRAATTAQVAELTAAAGLNTATYYLGDARVTSNGWAKASVLARNPADQGNEDEIFRLVGGHWKNVAGGSSFAGSHIPTDVLRALYG
jgi:hypothetical protein